MLINRRVSDQACEILKKLFPDWVPLSTNEEPCAICEACIHNSKEDKRELRRKAEDEKVRMDAAYRLGWPQNFPSIS